MSVSLKWRQWMGQWNRMKSGAKLRLTVFNVSIRLRKIGWEYTIFWDSIVNKYCIKNLRLLRLVPKIPSHQSSNTIFEEFSYQQRVSHSLIRIKQDGVTACFPIHERWTSPTSYDFHPGKDVTPPFFFHDFPGSSGVGIRWGQALQQCIWVSFITTSTTETHADDVYFREIIPKIMAARFRLVN